MSAELSLTTAQKQTLVLAPNLLQGLRLLQKSLPELREEIVHEMDRNPAIEDVDHPLETQLSEVQRTEEKADLPDYPEDDYEPSTGLDEEAAERRQAFFDRQVKEETLQEHLLTQLPLSDIAPEDYPMVEVLVGDLDDKGYYKGPLAEVAEAFGKSEAAVAGVLAKVMELDPPGCGARNARECLLAQLDAIDDLEMRETVRRLVTDHLDDIAADRRESVMRAVGLTSDDYSAAVRALRTLDGRPGRQYPSERERAEYINPEIHAVRRDGRWLAETDARSLPEIRLSKSFLALLEDPAQTSETKAYVKERIAAAQAFREAVAKRQRTIADIAQAIFDRQQEFFSKGFPALKPLTELEIAEQVGVHSTTVSRTVRDKYADTPQGTVELRRFFATGITNASGETVSQEAALVALRAIVAAEDKTHPLSDERLVEKLKESGYPVARRTVAKYRDKLGIPGTSVRRIR